MDVDGAVQAEVDKNDGVKPKAPRKPRPGEIAAKKAKKAAKAKRSKPKRKKPAKKPAKRKAPKKSKPKARKLVGAKRSKPKKPAAGGGARLDLRLSKADKAKLLARAKKLRRTVTSLVIELIEKLK